MLIVNYKYLTIHSHQGFSGIIYNTRWGTFQLDGLKRVEEHVFKSTSQLTPATELFAVANALLIRMPEFTQESSPGII